MSLILAVAALASALPALAKDAGGSQSRGDSQAQEHERSPRADRAPEGAGPRDGDPPGRQDAQEPATTPTKPQPEGSVRSDRPVEGAAPPESAPPAEEDVPPTTGRRVSRRSVGTSEVAEPIVEPPAEETDLSDVAAPAPRAGRVERIESGPAPARKTTAPRRGRRAESRGIIRAEPSAAPVRTARVSRPEPTPLEADAPPQPLPARLVPRPLRQIVEVVPGEIWAALGVLALMALLLGISSWLTARRAQRLQRQREQLLQENGLLQSALLPSVPEGVPVSAAYRPAEGPGAGGDFYEAFAVGPGRTGIILGEVAGDGREALARTTLIRYTLRAYLEAGLEPREVVKVGSHTLGDHLGSGFATVTVAVHDAESGRFTYASAGHHPPVVVGGEPHEPVTACSAPPLGLGERTGFRQTSFTLTAGAAVCLYTDGVTESRLSGRLLGVGRFERELADLPADAGAEDVLARIVEVADEVTDDMAVCVLRAPEDAPTAGARIEELEVDEREVGDLLEHFLRACGVPLSEVPGVLREAGEAARREGHATVRVRLNDFRPGVDVVPGNLVRLEERRRAARL